MQVEDVKAQVEVPQPDLTASSPDQKTVLGSIGGREIKDKLAELFTPNKFKPCPMSDTQLPEAATEKKKEWKNSGSLDWAAGYMPRSRAEISEACRQAFTATCHLLLECTTFPVYLSEEETLALHTDMFGQTGQYTVGLCKTNKQMKQWSKLVKQRPRYPELWYLVWVTGSHFP